MQSGHVEPYREPERIVLLFEADAARRSALEAVAPANFVDWQQQARTIDVMAAAEPFGFTYTGGSEPQSLPGMRVSQGFFDVFGMDAMYGRTFTPDEYTAGRNQVIVLGHGTWMRQFGGDRGIVGRTIRLSDQPYVVVWRHAAGVCSAAARDDPRGHRPRMERRAHSNERRGVVRRRRGESGARRPRPWTIRRGPTGARAHAADRRRPAVAQLLHAACHEPGFVPEGVAAVQVFWRLTDRTPAERATAFQQIVEGLRTLPNVQEAGAAAVIPFLDTTGGSSVSVAIDGRPPVAGAEEPSAFVNVVTPGYFPALRVPLLDGRIFDEHDGLARTPVVVVSRTFADTHWRGTSPVGQRIRFTSGGTKIAADIIGVVGDVRHDALDRPASQEIFVPHAQVPLIGMTFVARTTSDPSTIISGMNARIRAVIPGQAVYRTAVLHDLVSGSLDDRRFMLTLVMAFAVLAAALAASGVYGVMNVISTQRRKEYGLRIALGADRIEILRMVLREGAKLTLAGTAIGLVGAMIIGQVLRGFLFGVGSVDPWTLAAACATLGAVAGVACLVPALKATRVSPLIALRTD